MMIRWWDHSQKGVTDRQTDRQTDGRTDGRTEPFIELLGRSWKGHLFYANVSFVINFVAIGEFKL